MMDRLLAKLLNLTVVTMIAAVAAGSLIFGYGGLMQLLGAQAVGGAIQLLAATGFGLAVAALLRHRSDLIDQ